MENYKIDEKFLNLTSDIIEAGFECSECKSINFSFDPNQIKCIDCNEIYELKHNVLDALKNPPVATRSELLGMALENGYSENTVNDFKIRYLDKLRPLSEKLKQTQNDHNQYYQQTSLHFDQACAELGEIKDKKVLEIGSCHDYYFLKYFRDRNCDCFALNLHYDLSKEEEYLYWPKKIVADMNKLPFKDGVFDVIVISATSHHSTTPELLVNEISRVLKKGGKCLFINDPTWGIIKNLGGPDNTLTRHDHINENEYSIWRYNKMFRKSGLSYKHLFSEYYDQKLLNSKIHKATRFFLVAKGIQLLWKLKPLRFFAKKFLLWPAQAIFGFPMNVILTKNNET